MAITKKRQLDSPPPHFRPFHDLIPTHHSDHARLHKKRRIQEDHPRNDAELSHDKQLPIERYLDAPEHYQVPYAEEDSDDSAPFLSHFVVTEPTAIGAGGCGSVYRGTLAGQPVAVKMVRIAEVGELVTAETELQVYLRLERCARRNTVLPKLHGAYAQGENVCLVLVSI